MNKEEQIDWLKETYEWCKNFDFSKIPEELNEKFSIDDLILDYSMLWKLHEKERQALIDIKEYAENNIYTGSSSYYKSVQEDLIELVNKALQNENTNN